jgi:hypothetical protein
MLREMTDVPAGAIGFEAVGEDDDWDPGVEPVLRREIAWQDWSFQWTADAPGRHTLRARATDAAGNVQPDTPPWNRLGYGNNAIEVRYVDVA